RVPQPRRLTLPVRPPVLVALSPDIRTERDMDGLWCGSGRGAEVEGEAIGGLEDRIGDRHGGLHVPTVTGHDRGSSRPDPRAAHRQLAWISARRRASTTTAPPIRMPPARSTRR